MEDLQQTQWVEVDDEGKLVLPAEIRTHYGLTPGTKVRLEVSANTLTLRRSITHLNKVYVEPTSHCNIKCRTCIRNVWDEQLGTMTQTTFARIMAGIGSISPHPTVFFGGLGEPLFHEHISEMVAQAKAQGAHVELITNGTMLTKKRSQQLINAGLDLLWVSIDGATPESYTDVRLGAKLPKVLENLQRFREMRKGGHHPLPQIGVAFVAMKRNIADLPEVLAIARRLGATHFKVSNVLPYTDELKNEVLYKRVIRDITYMPSPWLPHLSLPKMEISSETQDALFKAMSSGYNVTFAGNNLGATNDVCVFVADGSISVGWDGSVSPCLALLHSHMHYVNGRKRISRRHIIGNVMERDLLDIWHDPDYVAYRERIQSFAFAPCTSCGGCEMLEGNEEDCHGNTFPACGGCLWAQGVIQCP